MSAEENEDVVAGYDKREARELYAIASYKSEPDTKVVFDAARRLATAIDDLDGDVGDRRKRIGKVHGQIFQLSSGEEIQGVRWPTLSYTTAAVVTIAHDGRAGIRLHGKRGGKEVGTRDVPDLCFNPLTNQFEGTEADQFINQEPGQPRAKRAALAVVVEAAFGYLSEILAGKVKAPE